MKSAENEGKLTNTGNNVETFWLLNNIAASWLVEGKNQKAMTLLESIVNNYTIPDGIIRYSIIDNLGKVACNLGHYELALDTYEEALISNPEFYKYHIGKARALNGLNEYQESIESYMRAVDIKGLYADQELADCYCSLGDNFYALNEYESAASAYKEAIIITPDDPAVWISLGDSYLAFEKYEDAIEVYSYAGELDPNCAEAYLGIGKIFLILKEYVEANSFYLQAIKIGGLTLDQLKDAKVNIDHLYEEDDARTIPDDENDIQALCQDLIFTMEASLIGVPMSDIS